MMRLAFSNLGAFCLAAVCVAALASGCAPEPYPKRATAIVHGAVTYKGDPLEMGQILFQPPSGPFVAAEIQSDGTYSLEAVVGPNTVQIISRDPPDESTPEDRDGKPPEVPKSHIPESYGGPKSGLEFEVEAGDNTADFDLK